MLCEVKVKIVQYLAMTVTLPGNDLSGTVSK